MQSSSFTQNRSFPKCAPPGTPSGHVLEKFKLYPETQVTIGPVIEDGFYYDFYSESPFIPEDLEKIELRMKELSAKNLDIVRRELPREKALKMFDEMGEPFKLEVINGIESDDPISIYSQGEFTDLCRGPHVNNTNIIKSFKNID